MSDKPTFSPVELVGHVKVLLRMVAPIDEEDLDQHQAYLAAASLLLALGFEPAVDPPDTSRAAGIVRELLIQNQVRTTTRARRQL